ncbi:uncharacterized protein LOC123466387 [Daphnia magna]|uniref:uncharacterized protein LOC123466387 n=1 Tax=Daphnia magna TaxID=35525 RepID=UPI001E1BABEE|nr:uncharacterized protein LOC123466387 [Daphnia magna]
MGSHVNNTLPPIFMKRDENTTFKNMKSDQISSIVKELELKNGRFDKVSIAQGGDLIIRPTSTKQQEELLKTTSVLNDSIEVSCSLPNSYTKQKMVIRQVPTGDTNEDIHQALKQKGYKVTNVHRFTTTKGTEKLPSTTVALEFEGPPPHEIFLNGLVFHPETQRPNPLRCKRCQKIGHTANYCSNEEVCPNCGKPHEDMTKCSAPPKCVNCNNNHPSSSPNCPKFSQMRAISRTINDGRPQIDEQKSTYSQAVRRNLPNTETNPEAEILKGQILAIQAEMTQLRTEREKIRTLEKKVDGLEDSVNQIQNTLSNLNKGQSSTNNKLDKLIGLIQNLPSLADTGDTTEGDHQEEPSVTMEEDHHEAPNPPNPREKNKQPIQTPKTPQDKHTNPYLKRLQNKNNLATLSPGKSK